MESKVQALTQELTKREALLRDAREELDRICGLKTQTEAALSQALSAKVLHMHTYLARVHSSWLTRHSNCSSSSWRS